MTSADALFQIGLDQHVFVAGMTGSGKTHGAMLLMRAQKKPFVIFDSKNSQTVAKFADRIITDHADLDTVGKRYFDPLTQEFKENPYEKVAFRTPLEADEKDLEELANKLAHWAFLHKHIGLYWDEFGDVKEGQKAPRFVGGVSKKGREFEVTNWTTTQRPVGIPKVMKTESSIVVAFKLLDPDDAQSMARATGYLLTPEMILALPQRQFYFVDKINQKVSGPFQFMEKKV